LSIENKEVPVLQMAIHLLVRGTLGKERPGGISAGTLRNR
jgi:methyl coenzyme M reductase alpha subunit